MQTAARTPLVAIACGGTGGHLYPGLAVAESLQEKGCRVALLVSPKQIDQDAVKSVTGMDIVTLPAVALQNRNVPEFLRGFARACRSSWDYFKKHHPHAVLAMGGFTCAPPVVTAKLFGAAAFIHESNAIPGRANRWLSPIVKTAFVGFGMAGRRLYTQSIRFTGTPVRAQFTRVDPASCRMALGLQPDRPVLVVTGGSQGAVGINDLVCRALPALADKLPALQYFHLTGMGDVEKVRAAYSAHHCRAVTLPFLTEMEMALGAATVALSRAGASSLAELAAMQVPAILIPFPKAADNHQYFNARAFLETGAARQLDQSSATPEHLAQVVIELVENESARREMQAALERWQFPNAAEEIAACVLQGIGLVQPADLDEEKSPSPPAPLPSPPRTARPDRRLRFQVSNLNSL